MTSPSPDDPRAARADAPPGDPAPSPPPRADDARALRPIAIVVAVVLIALAFFVGRALPSSPPPPAGGSHVEVRPSPNVVLAMRDLARLEGAEFHMERVLELADEQTRLFGLVHAKDAILLVAAGDVVAGVDLSKLEDGDVAIEPAAAPSGDASASGRAARIALPAPEIFSVAIDNARTRVVQRSTDTLATRSEALEGRARAEAEKTMREAAIEAGILDRARASTERTVRDLLRGLGFDRVEIVWK